MLKWFSALLCLLVGIFNALLSSCSFPDAGKEADVIGIPKTASFCRPISLLSTLGKAYERLILNRLRKYVFANKLLPDEQFGFRPEYSCTNQLHRLTEYIMKGFNLPKRSYRTTYTGALFFDVAKAFDKV